MSASNVGANTSRIDTFKVVEDARKAISDLLEKDAYLSPHFIRIAFFDAVTYNPLAKEDGPNGSIRLWEGLKRDDCNEMKRAIERLDSLKTNNVWSYLSYADLYQLAGIEAVKKAGGPSIEFRYGRMDSYKPVPLSIFPSIEEGTNASSVKDTFHHIGFTDKEIVALSSAYYYWMNYTQPSTSEKPNMDNSYYKKLLKEFEAPKSEASNAANTSSATPPSRSNTTTSPFRYWKCLLSDASFRKYVEIFAKDGGSFTKEYASAHKKLSELGFKHFPEPILMESEHHDIKHGIAFAVAMTILFGFVGFFYEVMRT